MPTPSLIRNWGTVDWTPTRPCSHATDGESRRKRDDDDCRSWRSTLSPQTGPLVLRIKELEEQHLAFRNSLICAFNQLLDLKDISTGVHSTRLAEWAIRVARKLNIPE